MKMEEMCKRHTIQIERLIKGVHCIIHPLKYILHQEDKILMVALFKTEELATVLQSTGTPWYKSM